MKKSNNKKKIKEEKKVTILDYLNNMEKGSDRILKLKLSTEWEEETGIFLVLEKSIKLFNPEKTYGDSEVVMLDAFYKNTVIDMKTCKNPLNPWNFKQDNIEDAKINTLDDYCLVKRIFPKNTTLEDISDSITKEEHQIQYAYDNKFLKIGNDEKVQYGDGGQMVIVAPLYYSKQLPLNTNVKTNLTIQLNKLGDERKDWHGECPVLDIIDPDLNPNYLSPTDMQILIDDNKKRYKEKNSIGDDDEDDIEQLNNNVLSKFPESLSLRSQYKWIPTEFLITKDLKMSLLGPIHNLPNRGNSELYANIVKVFESMLPGFQKLNLLKENEDTKLQVVVKAQKYELKPGMKYSGKWHIEGKTENIVAAGVYYCNIDKGFQEDKLLYRNNVFPDPGYAEQLRRTPDYEIDVFDGSAVVFSNTLPHRFKELVNSTKTTLTRTFLNFFIVDPSKPIECDGGKQEYWRLLKSMKLKNIIIGHILKFLSPLKYDTLEIAKQKRTHVREGMKTERSGWGFIHYGNSGDLEFFDAFHEFNNPEKYEDLEEPLEIEKKD